MYKKDISGNVPCYGQQGVNYCGEASAQMIMNGYPNPANKLVYQQTVIHNSIVANNSKDPVDFAQNWATDPIGLRNSIAGLNPPPGGSWIISNKPDKSAVMFDILYYLNKYNYPVATLVNHGGHWVVVIGYDSDIEPIAGSNPILQNIKVYDPEPNNQCYIMTTSGADWMSNASLDAWNKPISNQGSWHNNYVAVIEPPSEEGKVIWERLPEPGGKIIKPEEAAALAVRYVRDLKLDEEYPYNIMKRSGMRSFKPILVNQQPENKQFKRRTDENARVAGYYLVPFGFEREVGKGQVPLARTGVIVDAYTGRFIGIGYNCKPMRYMPENEAIDIVAHALQLTHKEKSEVKATMIFKSSQISHNPLNPFWEITAASQTLFVDQYGVVHSRILESPGD
jgi:hypothetical protein